MKQQFTISSIVGGFVGAAVISALVLALVFSGQLNGLRTIDALTFAVLVATFILALIVALAGFSLFTNWDRADRQKALEETGKRVDTEMKTLSSKLLRRNGIFIAQTLLLLAVFVGVSVWRDERYRRKS